MKKKLLIILPLAAAICISAAAVLFHTQSSGDFLTLEERVRSVYDFKMTGMANEHQFAYSEMLEAADIAVIARSADDLSEKNSVLRDEYDESAAASYLRSYCSMRRAEILAAIKPEKAASEIIAVNQDCAKLSSDTYVAYDGCFLMIKGDVYAVFALKNEGYDSVYTPLSTDNGILNLTYLRLNRRTDLAAMTAVSVFETDFPPELKDAYLNSRHPGNLLPEEILIPVFEDNAYPWQSITVTTPYTEKGMEITVEYTEVDGILYFRSGEFPGYYDPNE